MLGAALKGQGVDAEQLAAAGLVKPAEGPGETERDYFVNRIIFPITDRRGRVIAFGGRALGDSKAKYINSPETPLFQKGQVLYNLARARQAAHDTGELIVAEGYMDVIALAQGGFPAAVAPLGTAVTEAQITELWRLAREPILCLDGDAAGRRAAFRAAERALPVLKPARSLRFAFLPEGEDPDSFVAGQGAAALRDVLRRSISLADLLWLRETEGRDFATPERRAGLRQALRRAVEVIGDGELRDDYRAEMMQRFQATFQSRRRAGAGRDAAPRTQCAPVGLRTRRHGPERLRQRQEQLLLALLVHHPLVLIEHAEALSNVKLTSPPLERLRRALVDLAAQAMAGGQEIEDSAGPNLDTDSLKCHLSEQGFSGILDAVLSPDVLIHGQFARPGASMEAAEGGFVHLLALMRTQQSGAERDEAAFKSAVDAGDEEELARLQQRRVLGQAGEDRSAGHDWPEVAGQGDGN